MGMIADESFRATVGEDIPRLLAGKELLQVACRNKVLILAVFPDKAGNIGAEGNDAQMIGARKIQCGARELRA